MKVYCLFQSGSSFKVTAYFMLTCGNFCGLSVVPNVLILLFRFHLMELGRIFMQSDYACEQPIESYHRVHTLVLMKYKYYDSDQAQNFRLLSFGCRTIVNALARKIAGAAEIY